MSKDFQVNEYGGGKLTFLCHPEAEPEVQALLVSDITSESFRLAWMAEEDAFDTFVVMVSPAVEPDRPQELVLGGEERSTEISALNDNTEYKIELFGLIMGRRSKSIVKVVKTGT